MKDNFHKIQKKLQKEKLQNFKRRVSFGDLITDLSENAQEYGFGEGTTCYDNVLIIGDVSVGKNTWIGPNVILDGSGGLEIGDYCSISSGVQIYTHHTVLWSVTLGEEEYENKPTKIGNGVYVGPGSIIQMGVLVGDQVVIGAMSFVNMNIPSNSKAWGSPAKIVGEV